MELNHLRHFYFVAKENGFSNAARVMRVAQPAITKAVKRLESDLGVELFDRRGRRVFLTKAGNELYRKCEVIFEKVDEIAAIPKTKDECRGVLNIGAAEVVATHLVPSPLRSLLSEFPSFNAFIVTGTGADLLNLLQKRKIEIALLFHSPDLPPGIEVHSSYSLRHHLVVSAKAKSDDVCSTFIGSREVEDFSTNRYPTLTKLRRSYPRAVTKISANCLSAHKRMVLDGMGVSILPEFLVKEELRKKQLVPVLPKERFAYELKVLRRSQEQLSRTAGLYLKMLAERLEEEN